MKRITERQYQICKENGLLFDGKTFYNGINEKVKRRASYGSTSGRNYVRTRHGVYVTEGFDGIYDLLLNIEKSGANKNGSTK